MQFNERFVIGDQETTIEAFHGSEPSLCDGRSKSQQEQKEKDEACSFFGFYFVISHCVMCFASFTPKGDRRK